MRLGLFSTRSSFMSKDCYLANMKVYNMTKKEFPITCELQPYPIFGGYSDCGGLFKMGNTWTLDCINGVNKKNLDDIMKHCSIIDIPGGNTFQISAVLQLMGLYDFIKKFANEKDKVITGSSAGSIMCTPTIMSAQWADPMERYKDILPTTNGLNFVDFCIKPHSQSWLPKFYNDFLDFANKTNREFKCIPDGGAIIVDGKARIEYGDIKTILPGDKPIEYIKPKKFRINKSGYSLS